MNDEPLHRSGMHPGFLLSYGLLNLVVLAGLGALTWAVSFPLRAFSAHLPAGTSYISYFPLLPFFAMAVPLLAGWIPMVISYLKSEVVLSTESVRFKTGLFFRTEGHLRWSEVESVVVRQGPLGSVMGYGSLVLIGSGGTPFVLAYMPRFKQLRELALDLNRKSKDRRIDQAWSATTFRPETLETSVGRCADCQAPTTREDVSVCERSPRRFGGRILCGKCRSYLPPE